MWTSVPQIVVVVMRISASSGPTSGIGFSSSTMRPGSTKIGGFHPGHGLTSKDAQGGDGASGYLNPRYPRTKRTMTIAPTHQMILFIACSCVGDRFYRWIARPRDCLGERVLAAVPRGATGAGYDCSGK